MNRQPQLHALADVGLDKHVRLGPSKGFDASEARDDVRLMSIGHWQPDGAYGCDLRCPLNVCAVRRRRFPVGESPTRQPLQPEATGAVMEETKWLKPSV